MADYYDTGEAAVAVVCCAATVLRRIRADPARYGAVKVRYGASLLAGRRRHRMGDRGKWVVSAAGLELLRAEVRGRNGLALD